MLETVGYYLILFHVLHFVNLQCWRPFYELSYPLYLLPEGEENLLFVTFAEPSVKKFRVLSGNGLPSIVELIEIGFLRPRLGSSIRQYRVIHCLENFKQ
jgi:hypothetical protein